MAKDCPARKRMLTHTVLKKHAAITQTPMHVCARTRAHIGCGHETKAVKTKAEGRCALVLAGVMEKPQRGIAPGSPSHVQRDQMECMNVANKNNNT